MAPVVTRRPPVRLTGGRCHAAPGILASVPMFGGFPPRPVRLAVLGSGVGGGGVGDDAPPMVLRSLMRLAIPTRPMGEVSSALLTPLDHLGARLCLPLLPTVLPKRSEERRQ